MTSRERPEQLRRLDRFRAQYPGVVINRVGGFGFWQAWIPAGAGGTVITRYVLQDLLDELEDLHAPLPLNAHARTGRTTREASRDESDESDQPKREPRRAPGVPCCQTADPPPSMMCLRAATTTSALPSQLSGLRTAGHPPAPATRA